MHNLLKLMPIHRLEKAGTLFACFYMFFETKVRLTDLSDRITQLETFVSVDVACGCFCR